MDFLSHIAQLAGEQEFDLRVYVFYVVFDAEVSVFDVLVDVAQLGGEGVEFFGREQSDAFEHGDVGDGAQYVIRSQKEVHLAVASYGKAVNVGVDLYVFFPKFVCHDGDERGLIGE